MFRLITSTVSFQPAGKTDKYRLVMGLSLPPLLCRSLHAYIGQSFFVGIYFFNQGCHFSYFCRISYFLRKMELYRKIIRTVRANPWGYKVWLLSSPTLGRKSPTQSRKLSSHDEAKLTLFSANQNIFRIFLFSWFRVCFPYGPI